jgi:uncharacterized membrane protein
MSAMKSFVKATITGGLLFLVPVVLLLVVLKHAMQLAAQIAKPIAAHFSVPEVGGVAVVTLIAAAVLLVIAFGAGLLARTTTGRRITSWFEESILGGLPQYRMVKSMAEGLAQVEDGRGMQPVLLRGDEGWMLAYQLERLPDGWVAVFVPAAPTPMSGNVMYVSERRIRPLDISMPEAMKLVKSIGVGSADALRGVDFGSAREA